METHVEDVFCKPAWFLRPAETAQEYGCGRPSVMRLNMTRPGCKLLVELEGILVTGFLRRFPLLAR